MTPIILDGSVTLKGSLFFAEMQTPPQQIYYITSPDSYNCNMGGYAYHVFTNSTETYRISVTEKDELNVTYFIVGGGGSCIGTRIQGGAGAGGVLSGIGVFRKIVEYYTIKVGAAEQQSYIDDTLGTLLICGAGASYKDSAASAPDLTKMPAWDGVIGCGSGDFGSKPGSGHTLGGSGDESGFAGGGGGFGGAGDSVSYPVLGNGGVGISFQEIFGISDGVIGINIYGDPYFPGYFAGGGGGAGDRAPNAKGGIGGGGAGGLVGGRLGEAGLKNTGGGAGGSLDSGLVLGGSGIVILRYAIT